jgi:recombinational DNA repair protein RecR
MIGSCGEPVRGEAIFEKDLCSTYRQQEVILVTNTNLEGEQTAMYLSRVIAPLGIKVTRLARGLPFGT